jgi:integrase
MKKVKDKPSVEQRITDLERRWERNTGKKAPRSHGGHARRPSLYWYARTERGWRYMKTEGINDSLTVQYPGGRWFVRLRDQNGKQSYEPVKGDPAIALGDARRRAKNQDAVKPHMKAHASLAESVSAFLKNYADKSQLEAAKKAKSALREFRECHPDLRITKHITQQHVLDFHNYLRKQGKDAPRTVANKHKIIQVFLKFCKLDLDVKDIQPRYEQGEPTVYTPDEIDRLLSEASEHMTLCIEMGRQLGLREREMMFSEFSDILPNRTFRVQGKAKHGFTIKTWEQRIIPMGQKLYDLLDQSKGKRPRSMILGIGKGYAKPDLELLQKLKRIARRADVPVLGENSATLHKFRRTAITAWLRSKLDIKTVQRMAGHKSLDATLRYLRALEAESLTDHVDAIF